MELGLFPFPSNDVSMGAHGSISPLGRCRQKTGRGLSLARGMLWTCLLLPTGSRVRYGRWPRLGEPVSPAHCPGIWQELPHPNSDMKSQVWGAGGTPETLYGMPCQMGRVWGRSLSARSSAESQARHLLVILSPSTRSCLLLHPSKRTARGPDEWRPSCQVDGGKGAKRSTSSDICGGFKQAGCVVMSAGEKGSRFGKKRNGVHFC